MAATYPIGDERLTSEVEVERRAKEHLGAFERCLVCDPPEDLRAFVEKLPKTEPCWNCAGYGVVFSNPGGSLGRMAARAVVAAFAEKEAAP